MRKTAAPAADLANLAALLPLIPDEDLKREYMRRHNQRRKAKPPVLRPCEYCGQQFGAREMRVHVPRCTAREALS